jgi:copper chaperone
VETATLKVEGMTCQGCVRSVTRVLQGLKGVASAEVSLDAAQATVTFDPAQVDLARLKAAIEQAGYEAA